ncbi:MAG: AsmA-like C-terminal region-containing protein [Planctomycetota bacterium]
MTATAVGVYIYSSADEQIRLRVEAMLTEKFPNLNVSVGGARWIPEEGVELYNLNVSETAASGRQENLLLVEEVRVACRLDLAELVAGPPKITSISVRHPQLWVNKRGDGTWNLESFWPLPQSEGPPPPLAVHKATVTIADNGRPQLSPLVLRDVSFRVSPVESDTVHRMIEQFPQLCEITGPAPAPPRDGAIQVSGFTAGIDLRGAEFAAVINPAEFSATLAGRFEALQVSDELSGWLASYAGGSMGETDFRGRVDGEFSFNGALFGFEPPQAIARLTVENGQLRHPRLPRDMTSIAGRVSCRTSGLELENATGMLGAAPVRLSARRDGWTSNAPIEIRAAVEQLPLDERLRASLPNQLLKLWNKYRPEGRVEATADITIDRTGLRPDITLRGSELAFESDKYAYRLKDGAGTLHLHQPDETLPPLLDIDITGYGGGRPIRIAGRIFNPGPLSYGGVNITGNGLQVEPRMVDAIQNAHAREVIRSMHTSGTMDVACQVERTEPGGKFSHRLRLEIVDGALNYEKFPYPVSGVTGVISSVDGNWTFSDIVSSGAKAVQCSGRLTKTPGGHDLVLNFQGRNLPFDRDLQRALPESERRAWAELNPRGNADFTAIVRRPPGVHVPTISVAVSPNPETASFRPNFFPYDFSRVEGNIEYSDGVVQLKEVRAAHGPTKFRTNGLCEFAPDGRWSVQLEGLTADRLSPSDDLLDASPETLRRIVYSMRPSGGFGLHNGVLRFSKAAGPRASVISSWDVSLDCHQANITAGVELRNCHGSVRLFGEHGRQQYTAGELNLETVTVRDTQLTSVSGPFVVDANTCWLGRNAIRPGRTPRPILATSYGGSVGLSGTVVLQSAPKYLCEIECRGVDLQRLMIERFSSQQSYVGKVDAEIDLKGTGASLTTLRGEGVVKVRDANIYELPLLVSLLKVLRSKTPDATAFNEVDANFRMTGKHIVLEQLNFLGDAVQLYGSGYTNLDEQLNLEFRGTVGRDDRRLPFWTNVLGGPGQGILRMYVSGTVSNPQVATQAFPGFYDLIEQFQTNAQAPAIADPRNAGRSLPTSPRFGRR